MQDSSRFKAAREAMIREQLEQRGIRSTQVLSAMEVVPRHFFVPDALIDQAYSDRALPLGPGQSISQPYIVAYMLEALELEPAQRVLEIGTGSGYQTALLAEITGEVYSIELDPDLHEQATELLRKLNYTNVHLTCTNGFRGWPQHAPYDRIIVSAAPDKIPRELVRQLADRGRLVLPFGKEDQELIVVTKQADKLESRELGGVRFVEMLEEDTEGF